MVATFSSPDITLLRDGLHDIDPLVINAVPLIPVATARVNQATFTYPLAQISVDGTANWSKAKRGRLFSIGSAPGFADITWGVCKKDATSDTLYCDAKSLGDPGYAREIHVPILDDYYITVYKYRPPWGLVSSIRDDVFYKQYDIPYDGSGSNPDPWLRLGDWRQAFVGTDGKARLSFSNQGSYLWGKSFTSCLWDSDGAAYTVGSSTSRDIELEFDPGFYEISCQLLDDRGRSRTGYRYVWINTTDPADANAPLSYKYPVTCTRDSQDRTGRNVAIQLHGPLDTDTLFPGQAFLFTERATFDGGELTDQDLLVTSYVGYASDKSTDITRKYSRVSVSLQSPVNTASGVPCATNLLEEVRAPSDWTQCTYVLSNPIGAAWYICAHHAPYLIEGHDWDWDASLLIRRRKEFGFQTTDIGGQLKQLADMVLGNIGARSSGLVRFLTFPHYLEQAARDDLGTFWTWMDVDVVGDLTIPFQYRMGNGQVFGYAFAYDGSDESTPFAALAPGYAQRQSPGIEKMTPFMVPFANGQETTERWTGHHHARLSNPTPDFNLTVNRNMDFTEPCDLDKIHALGLDASYDPEGVGWVGKKIMPTRVTRTWAIPKEQPKKIAITFEVLTFGQRGIFQPVDRGAGATQWTNQWNPYLELPLQPAMPDLGVAYPVVLAVNDRGLLARTFTFTDHFCYWEHIGVSGTVRDVVINPQSPYILETGPEIIALVVADVGSTIKVYEVFGINDPYPANGRFTVSTLATITADASYNGKVHIRSSSVADFFLVAYQDGTGVYVTTCTDPSHTFAAPVQIGATLSPLDTYHSDSDLGVYVRGAVQVILAPDGTLDGDGHYQYFPYWCNTTSSISFGPVSNVPTDFRSILGSAFIDPVNDGWFAMEKDGSPTPPTALDVVTFDPGGYPEYDIGPYGITNSIGPGSNVEYGTANGIGFNSVHLRVNLLAEYEFRSITFDYGVAGSLGSPIPETEHWVVTVSLYDNDDHLIGQKTIDLPTGFQTTITAQEIGATEYTRYVDLNIHWEYESLGSISVWYLWLDNVDVQADRVIYAAERRLYSVVLSSGTWTDNSPNEPDMPQFNYAIDKGADMSMVARDQNQFNFLFYGTPWARIGRTKYLGVKRPGTGTILIGFGYNCIDLSPDKGATAYPRIGDWSASVGPVGAIVAVAGVF